MQDTPVVLQLHQLHPSVAGKLCPTVYEIPLYLQTIIKYNTMKIMSKMLEHDPNDDFINKFIRIGNCLVIIQSSTINASYMIMLRYLIYDN